MSNTLLAVMEALAAEHGGLGRTGYVSGADDALEFQSLDFMGLNAADLVLPGAPVYFPGTTLKTVTDTTIAFVTSTTPDTITDSGNGLADFEPGEIITVSGSTSNDGDYTVVGAVAGTITVAESLPLAEAAGDTVTITATKAWRWVETTPAKTSITVEIEPTLSGTPEAGERVHVWHRHLQTIPAVKKAISRADNEFCHRWVLTPLTILLDGDMEKTAYGDWTAGDSATLSKTATGEGEPVRQFLVLSNSANAGYAYQASLQVSPNQQYSIAVLGSAASTTTHTAKLVVIDVTNSNAEITLNGDGDEFEVGVARQVLRNTFTIPAGCVHIQVRLGVKTAADDALYGWAALTNQSAQEVVLPDRVKDAASVGRVFQAVRRVSDPYEPPGSWDLEEVQVEKLSVRGTGGVTLRFPGQLGDGLYFYEEWQGYPELTADTDTTEAPLDWLVAEAALECYKLADRQWNAGNVNRLPPPGAFGRDASPWWPLIQKQAYICKAARADALGKRVTVVSR